MPSARLPKKEADRVLSTFGRTREGGTFKARPYFDRLRNGGRKPMTMCTVTKEVL